MARDRGRRQGGATSRGLVAEGLWQVTEDSGPEALRGKPWALWLEAAGESLQAWGLGPIGQKEQKVRRKKRNASSCSLAGTAWGPEASTDPDSCNVEQTGKKDWVLAVLSREQRLTPLRPCNIRQRQQRVEDSCLKK